MKRITFFTKSFLLTTIFTTILSIGELYCQTVLISPTGDGGFETGATFAANGWSQSTQPATSFWEVGNTATAYAGSREVYVANTAGTYSYNSSASRTSHFYRDVVIPAGATNITLSFYWKGKGESGYDRALVYTAPTSVTPVKNVPASPSTTLTGATLAWTQPTFTNSATYTLATITLPNTLAGTTTRVIFTWQNDASGGTTPGAAIDNISLTCVIPPPCAGTPTGGTTAATLSTGCSGYTSILSVTGGSTESGTTYQWESSPTNAAPWTPIPGATSATYSATVNSNIYYQRKITCTASGQSAYSVSVLLNAASCYLISNATTVTTCTGFFYDSGSNTADYSSSESYTKTICATAGLYPRVTFTTFETESLIYDYLKIYDGNSTAAPLLGTWGETTGPGTITGNNTCLTYQFTSDGSVESAGWEANLSCVSPCSGTPTGGTAAATVTSGCAGYTSVLSVSGATTDPGLTYQWQSGPTATGPWTNVVGATNATYTATINSSLFYIRITTCTNGGASATSSALLFDVITATNDECANAITIVTNSTSSCTNFVTGTVCGATASSETNSCSGTSDDDVWYSFVATFPSHIISLSNVVGSATNMYFAVYSGTCGSLSNLVCSDANSSTVPGLTVGNTYYVRVYTYTSTAGQNTNFDICVSTPSLSTSCGGADPFCTGTALLFPANVSSEEAEVGPDYGCLCSQPSPSWYYLKIANPGSLTINISSSCGDVDYAAWGPFATLTCSPSDLTTSGTFNYENYGTSTDCEVDNFASPSGNMVDCAFSSSDVETLIIPAALTDQFYLVMITNYAECTGNINFNQTAGTGSTDCSIIAPPITNNGPLCAGQTLQLTVPNPTAGAIYDWTGPNGYTSTDMNPSIPNVTTANAGIYSLIITVGGVNSAPVTTTVVINALPTPIVGSNSPVCAGTALNFTSQPNGATSYSWSGPNSFTSSVQNPSITNPTTAASGSYIVTVTMSGGCTGTAQTDVVINPSSTPSALNNGPLCSGNTLNLTSTPTGAINYSWSGPNGFTSAIQNPIVTNVTAAHGGVYTVTVTALGGCTATAQTTLTINGNLTITPTSNSPICENQTLNLSVPTAGATYVWSGPNGFASAIQNPSIANATVTVSGTYLVTVTIASGCSGTSSINVLVNTLPSPSISGNFTICAGKSTTLTASGGNSYQWSNGPLNSTNSVSPASQTSYTVTVTTTAGCSATTSQIVSVNANPIIDNIATTNELCDNHNGQAIATVSLGLAPYQYNWSNNGPNNSTNPLISGGAYSVTITDANGCTTTSNFTIQNIPGPQLTVSSVNPDHCNQGIGSATVIVNAPGTFTYTWLTDTIQNGNTASSLVSGTYFAMVTDGICFDTIAVTINNIPAPIADFEPSPPSASASNATIRFINKSTGGSIYHWDFGDGTTNSELSPMHEFLETNTYTVTLLVTDAYGCFDTISKTVLIYEDLNVYIPNAFTPNSDNQNEVFKPYGSGINFAKPYELTIYNRWGSLVFTSNDYEKGWDGSVDGTRIKMTGTYTYRVVLYDYTNKKRIYVGSFSLLASKFD